jgi:hypothetical protein
MYGNLVTGRLLGFDLGDWMLLMSGCLASGLLAFPDVTPTTASGYAGDESPQWLFTLIQKRQHSAQERHDRAPVSPRLTPREPPGFAFHSEEGLHAH